jgi:histidinol-phosphate aminotransferase
VGAIIAHPTTLMPIRRILPPFSINVCAAIALQAAMTDRAYVEWYVAEAAQSRELIYEWCRALDVQDWPSVGNFVLLRIGDQAKACVEALASQEIYIRDKTSTPGCEGCIRITAGLVEDTRVCLAAMEEWHASRGH